MPRPAPVIKRTNVIADVPVTLVAETVIATLPGISTQSADEPVQLLGFAQITIGTTGTAVTLRVRRGVDTTGVLIGEGNAVQGAAGNTVNVDVDTQDVPGEVAGQSYVLTAQQTAATANGTSLQSTLAGIVGGS